MTKQEIQNFIKTIASGAIEGFKKNCVLPSLTIAQACLESGYGKYAPQNNLFGMKWYKGCNFNFQLLTTKEYYNLTQYNKLKDSGDWFELIEITDKGKYHVRIKSKFKSYLTLADSVCDHTVLLSAPRYIKVRQAKDYKTACHAIKEAGYATDINYPSLLISIIEQYNLDEYDKQVLNISPTPQSKPIDKPQPIPESLPINFKQLSKDDKGDLVKDLQKKLNKLGFHLIIDGEYGISTESAVKTFQLKNKLGCDGIVGKATMTLINKLIVGK